MSLPGPDAPGHPGTREKAGEAPSPGPAAGPAAAAALQIRELRYTYPDGTEALAGVDLTVQHGESVALIGPNGAGKSTLALHVTGLLQGDGEIRVYGTLVGPRTLREIRSRVGIVFQDPEDQLFMPTLGQDVAFGPMNQRLAPEEVDARVAEALRAVGLEESSHRPPGHLSFGQKKRAAIATVLSMRPDLLVLDEPSSNLDPAARRSLAELLVSIDATRLVVTHDLPYALQTCARVAVMSRGRIIADGPSPRIIGDRELLATAGLEWPFGFTMDL